MADEGKEPVMVQVEKDLEIKVKEDERLILCGLVAAKNAVQDKVNQLLDSIAERLGIHRSMIEDIKLDTGVITVRKKSE